MPPETSTRPAVTLSARDFDAVLFDLDGVLTDTASIHAVAWKRLFDDFLARWAELHDQPFVPFDAHTDYLEHVDGKPRYDGVSDFLAARGVTLPWDSPEDEPSRPSISLLGARKDAYFAEQLSRHGAPAIPAAVALVRALRENGIRTAVVSSSRNCGPVLEAAGISHLFDDRVDGLDVEALALPGKPAPDTFLEAAIRLGTEPSRAVVVEDALAGVRAGTAGRFGCVIAVDRHGQRAALQEAGASVVVASLAEVAVEPESDQDWTLRFDGFDPDEEGSREALCALGNGYFATRGALPFAEADAVHYPGTYIAGGYNRLRSHVASRTVENEDLVNFPNWLHVRVALDEDDWLELGSLRILAYHQALHLQSGLLSRRLRIEDAQGRQCTLRERRLVSMDDMHQAGFELSITADNWDGTIRLQSGIDGRIVNDGAKLYEEFNNRHLEPVAGEPLGEDGVWLKTRTNQSELQVAMAARTRLWLDGQACQPERAAVQAAGYVGQRMRVDVRQGATLRIEKLATVYTSRDPAISECGLAARKALARMADFAALETRQRMAWRELWHRFDLHLVARQGENLEESSLLLLRLNTFHLLQAVSSHSRGLDIGVPSRGWTGEAYQGHIFWDELFIFPFFNMRMPEVTRSLLMYRFRRLEEARAAAREAGYAGAMFPWQSGSDGQEETQEMNLNHRSRRWMPDNSHHQRHIGSAVAYNVWQYYEVTGDLEFLESFGAEILLDVAHFWASIATFDTDRQRYSIRRVMGPDEYHDGYPDAEEPGIDNNAYTNVMAAWVLIRAREVYALISDMRRVELLEQLGIPPDEVLQWDDISRRLYIPFHEDGIISQFEGYEALAEFDWAGYRQRYDNIQRLDLILEAEGDSTNRYRLSKQADTLMLFYLFEEEELVELFARLGYDLDADVITRTVDFYSERTSHGSTLSRVVHAWVLARQDRSQAVRLFAEALQSDVIDIQEGTTAEGVHLASMAGSVDLMQRATTGLSVRGGLLHITPQLPPEMERLDLRIHYRGHALDVRLSPRSLTVHGRNRCAPPIGLCVNGETVTFEAGSSRVFRLQAVQRPLPVLSETEEARPA